MRATLLGLGAWLLAVDEDYAIWAAFDNQYWPALYFVDAQGRIVHHHFGEGQYARLEAVLRELLLEAGATQLGDEATIIRATGPELDADWTNLRSPETYLGRERTQNFASPERESAGPRVYATPARLRLNHWALSGEWTTQREAVELHRAPGRIAFRFHARDLHLVMAPGLPARGVRFRVRIDGRPPAEAHGVDVDADGHGSVVQPRMYQLIRQRPPIVEHDFEIEFLDAPVRAFSFTFG